MPHNIFFIYGSEIVLKNNSKDIIYKSLSSRGFVEKITLNKEGFDQIDQTIFENAGGSLFGSKIIIEINHDQGKIPDQIIKIFEIENINKIDNIAIVINSNNEKLNSQSKWVKAMDELALIIECKKLKSFEEKIWLKHQLSFVSEIDRSDLIQNISEMNSGNLVAQQNEINILKLTYEEGKKTRSSSTESAEFMPFELEDEIISRNTKKALKIIHSIKSAEDHYAPLLVWIVGKIINSATNARQSKNPINSLIKSGVWSNKTSEYMNFIKNHKLQNLIELQKNIFELDLANKGLSEKNFWYELDNIVVKLTTS
jgi:DNA polymerase III delta subunit